MSEITAVYTSNDPRHRDAFEAVRAKQEAVMPARKAFAAEYPGAKLMGHDGTISTIRFETEPDMNVWRKAQGRNAWMQFVPRVKPKSIEDRKTADELRERMKAMSAPERASFVGMPDHSGWFTRPGYRLVDDTLWLWWGETTNFETIEKDPAFDGTIWQRRKVSEYYVMTESLEEKSADKLD